MNIKMTTDVARKASLLILLLCVLISNVACSEAEGVVSNIRSEGDVVIDRQGNPDYAVAVYCTVENVGKAGEIDVSYRLSSSEGDWHRRDALYFEAGQSRNLKKLFPEPTIIATDVDPNVDVFPRPSSPN